MSEAGLKTMVCPTLPCPMPCTWVAKRERVNVCKKEYNTDPWSFMFLRPLSPSFCVEASCFQMKRVALTTGSTPHVVDTAGWLSTHTESQSTLPIVAPLESCDHGILGMLDRRSAYCPLPRPGVSPACVHDVLSHPPSPTKHQIKDKISKDFGTAPAEH